jgi:Cft2 family RNA processing exonuclease
VLVDCGLYQGGREVEEEAERRPRKGLRHPPGPLYGTLDALDGLDRFGRLAAYGTPLEVAPGIRATFLDAGHILGSACILLELRDGDRERRILLSGDLGSSGRPILRDPTPPPEVDAVVMESTYGDRAHRDLEASVEELHEAIRDTVERVRHHLRHNLARHQSSVIFVGFAARGTLAREIVDGAQQVRIYGEDIAVRARIHTIDGFSAHADRAELLAWHASTRAKRTFLVHGEEEPMRALARRLENTKVEMPSLHAEIEL